MGAVSYLTGDVDGKAVVVVIHGDPPSGDLRTRLDRKFAGSSWSLIRSCHHATDFAAIARGHFGGRRVEHRSITEKRPYG